jgi:hypothetical protein
MTYFIMCLYQLLWKERYVNWTYIVGWPTCSTHFYCCYKLLGCAIDTWTMFSHTILTNSVCYIECLGVDIIFLISTLGVDIHNRGVDTRRRKNSTPRCWCPLSTPRHGCPPQLFFITYCNIKYPFPNHPSLHYFARFAEELWFIV